MSIYAERAQRFRDSAQPRYNCAQAVAAAFAEEAGIGTETAYRFGTAFGGGMRRGSVCGAVTGGLMALGLFGVSDEKTIREFQDRFMETHADLIDCGDLLREQVRQGAQKKTWCDALVRDAADLAAELLTERGLLPAKGETK